MWASLLAQNERAGKEAEFLPHHVPRNLCVTWFFCGASLFPGDAVIIGRDTGEGVRSNNIGQRNPLSGVARFPG